MTTHFETINFNNNVSYNNQHWQIKTVRGQHKNLQSLAPLTTQELPELQALGFSQQDLKLYSILRSYVGTPYGPVYPSGERSQIYHTDCVDLLWQYLFDAYGLELNKSKGVTFDRNDKIYARLTTPITSLHFQDSQQILLNNLGKLKTGDIAFHGHRSNMGEAGISVWHAFIIGKPIINLHGQIVDYTIFNPTGYYYNERQAYTGMVVEGGAPNVVSSTRSLSLLETLQNKNFWYGANGSTKRQEIFIGRVQ